MKQFSYMLHTIHEELSQTCPVYQKLYESQAKWYR